MTPAEHLRAARALLTPPGAWTRGKLARNREGKPTACDNSTAMCWCVVGAIVRVSGGRSVEIPLAIVRRAVGRLPEAWNDVHGRTQAEVLAAFDKAIELAEAQS